MTDTENKILTPLRRGKLLLIIGIPLCLATPLLFTQSFLGPNFLNTGQIGDTIGGICSPFINILGSILIFLALKAQIEANLIIQRQIDNQKVDRVAEIESKQLNQYYQNIQQNIDNFTFSTQSSPYSDTMDSSKGSEAIYKLWNWFFCDNHLDEEQIKGNPKLSELFSILEICSLLLTKLKKSNVPDKETLWVLTKHQFEYRIFPRLRTEFPDNIKKYHCSSCDKFHGLPENMCELIKGIHENLQKGL